jgi:Ca-activated chloride channel family protein
MDATLQFDHHPHATERGTVVRALLTIAGTVPEGRQRPPLGLSLVLDRSGSMAGAKLQAVAEASARAVERLHPDDLVSAVAFDNAVDTLAEPAPVRQQAGLPTRLRQLFSGGSTNLSGGWLRGRQHMTDIGPVLAGAAGASRRVVLLTDGQANAGITDVDTLVALARTARADGITTSTIGVGEGYDDALLRAMADAGGGNAWYIEDPDQAQDVFAEELGTLLSVAAQGLTVTLTLHHPVNMLVVHSGWPTVPGAQQWRFDLGDLYASEPKPLLVELFVPSDVEPGSEPLATLEVRADVLTADGVEQRQLTLPIAASLDAQGAMVPEVERAIVLARVARAREEAARHQRSGDPEQAAGHMARATEAVRRSPLIDHPVFGTELRTQADDLEQLREQYANGGFDEYDAKYQVQRAYNARRGKLGYDEMLRRKQRRS